MSFAEKDASVKRRVPVSSTQNKQNAPRRAPIFHRTNSAQNQKPPQPTNQPSADQPAAPSTATPENPAEPTRDRTHEASTSSPSAAVPQETPDRRAALSAACTAMFTAAHQKRPQLPMRAETLAKQATLNSCAITQAKFKRLQELSGRPFTWDACCDDDASNTL